MNFKSIKTLSIKIFNNLEIIFIAIIVFLSPLIVNYTDLPKGYELAKVTFFQICTIILFFVFISKNLFAVFKNSKLTFSKDVFIALFFIILILITTFLSDFQNIAIFGNQFRFQGAITHILMVLFLLVLYKKGNERNMKLIFWAFFISAIIQSFASFGQLRFFIENDPKAIFEGYYINGTFGQANFYSGRIMLGILSGVFLLAGGFRISDKFNRFTKALLNIGLYFLIPLSIFILIFGLIISFSTWGIIVSGLLLFILIIYEIVNSSKKARDINLFGKLFAIILFIGGILSVYILSKLYQGEYNIRLDIWKNIYFMSTSDSFIRVLLGYGYDTLGEVFRMFGYFKGLYVDRAHNFFLDVYFQNGVLALITLLSLIFISTAKFIKKHSSKIGVYFFLGMFFWLIRSFVHESGIVNLYDFLVLFGATLALQKDVKLKLNLPKLKR